MKPFGPVSHLRSPAFATRFFGTLTATAMAFCCVYPGTACASPELTAAHIPLFFEQGPGGPNSGFTAHSPGCVIRIDPAETTLLFRGEGLQEPAPMKDSLRSIRMRVAGANRTAQLTGAGQLPAKVNYLLGKDSSTWKVGAALFAQVRVDDIYPGIDLVYYGNGERLEYDFLIKPHADPSVIRFEVAGADRLRIDEGGDLLLSIGGREMRQHRPVVYQVRAGKKTEVPGEYRLVDATVSFQLGDFDPALPLVIDPVFSFSTYVGGISDDSGWDVSTDQAGNIYITGETLSPWMATAGAFRPYFSGGTAASGGDAFVAKFDPSGTRLFYLTYLGGTGNDGASALAVDASGAVYVTGVTDSPDFPMAFPIKWFISGDINPYLPLYPYDAFVSKIDPSGSRLIYSTYLGGRGSDQAMDIAVDSQGSAYVTGFTQSGDFPTSRFSRKFAGKSDAFIAKLTPNGRNFAYSIFLGGRGSDRAHAIVLDAEQQATIVGFTDSTTFPLTNAFQTFLAGGKDAFFATVSRDGSRLLQSTYWGGLGDDIAYDAALDQTGTLHVTGSQSGLGFPIIPGNLNPGGVFKTLDGGDAWQAANTGLLHPDVRNIALSPSHPSIVYLDTWRGIFRSSDAGQSWAPVLPSVVKTPRSMVVSPENPDVLYATSGSRVLITTNGGSSWFFSAKGLPQVKVTKVLPVPGSGSIIYAATALGVYRSTNAAASWRYSSRGLGAQAVHDLVISPADPSVLYASTSAGVYRSTDAGASWSRANKGLRTAILRSLSPDPQNPLTVYGGASAGGILKPGLFKTTNGGSNWVTVSIVDSNTNLLAGNVHVTSIVVEPADSSIVYIGSTRGVFKSLDQGAHWTALTNGFTVSHITSLAVASQNPGTLYVGTIGRGSFGASDAFVTRFGSSFHSMSFGGKNVDQPLAIAADAQGNSFVTGTTASLNFPTKAPTSALSSSNRGGYDAFVTVINPEGSAFVYSGFLGGRGSDKAMGISLDADENPVLVGRTSSANFPVARPFRSTRTGASDAFITRLLNVE